MTRPDIRPARLTCVLALLLAAMAPTLGLAQARTQATALPAWEQLTPAQRDQLIAPLRERWNANPQQRIRMLGHAQRWQQLSPEQRARAHRGRDRMEGMTPAERAQARAAFQQMRAMPEAERRALRETLRAMTPEQRAQWLRQQAQRTPQR